MAILSFAMIVKNEEKTLGRVLYAVNQFCDEVIVCDTGSTDGTIPLAVSYGARVVHFPWVNDFAAARNFAFSHCTGDWIFWLDADDVLSPETIEIGKRIKAELLDTIVQNAIFCPYNYAYGDDGQPVVRQSRERFLRRSASPHWVGRVHEVVADIGLNHINCPEFVVEHRTDPINAPRKIGRNLAIFESYIDLNSATPRELYLYAGELRAAGRFEDAEKAYRQYLQVWPQADFDLFQEPYIVRVDLCEALRRLARPEAALVAAFDAINYDPTRAEGYALAAITLYEQNRVSAAFPLFMAAACCKPPEHGGLVYRAFYGEHVKEMVKECRKALDAAAAAPREASG